LRVDYELSSGLDQVTGTIKTVIEGTLEGLVEFSILKNKRILFRNSTSVQEDGTAEVDFSIQNPDLWFPHGYGDQDLYEVQASIDSASSNPFVTSKKIGFRKAELIQERDDVGKSFYFRINGRHVFCGGSDWIPADSFTPRVTAERYKKWLQILVDGNQSMIRYVMHD
jgi:beta-mannosidase